jgi:SPP1 gp7 family putative phage head morphogenesis protein
MDLSKLEQQALNTLLKNEAKYSKQIQKALLDALTSIYGEMTKIYDKYAVDGLLTKVEMTKYNKYQTMEKQILDKLDPAIKKNIESIKHLLPEQYQESFYHYAWAIDNATGLRLSWGMVNTKQLLGAFDITNPKNIELQNALTNYGVTAKKNIRNALIKNLAQGKSLAQMAKDIKLSVNKIYSSALTIARTEGMRAINAGQNETYLQAEEMGIQGNRVWSATLDSKTRPDHAQMDGESPKEDGLYHLPNGETALYPHDPSLSAEEVINCRCSERYEVEGYSPQLRRTREEGIIPYQSYQSYAEEYHPDWLEK